MEGKVPRQFVVILIVVLIMTHELFRRSGVQEPHLLRGRHWGGGHLPKNEFFANFENSFRKFRNVWIVYPSLDVSSMRIKRSLKPRLGTTRHHQVRWGSELDPCSFPRVLSGKASEEGATTVRLKDAERGTATEGHQVLELGHMCDPPPP